jgi:uncharacterized protein (DUF362 family)
LNRRGFLIRGAQASMAGMLAAAGLGRVTAQTPGATSPPVPDASAPGARATAPGDSIPPAPATPPRADLVRALGDPAQTLSRAIDAIGGIGRFVRPGQIVVIKPSASFVAPPEWGATTHPAVLSALLELCVAAGARRVFVVDHTLAPAERCFERSGIAAAVAAVPAAKLLSLADERDYEPVDVPAGVALHRTAVASIAAKADVLINLPTAKSHTATGVSFGLKNLMGLIWDRTVFHSDMDIHVGIADLATVLRPQLTVLDAMVLLTTGGPSGPGDVVNYGGIVVGTDPVAVDAYAVGLAPWNRETLTPDQVGFLRHAAQRGLGTLDLKALRVLELA